MRRRAGRQAGNNMHNVGRLKCAERERKRAEWGETVEIAVVDGGQLICKRRV